MKKQNFKINFTKFPKAEKGFTHIPNKLFDALIKTKLSIDARAVFGGIMGRVYGERKERVLITIDEFYKESGINKPNILRAIKRLQKLNMIGVFLSKNNDYELFSIQQNYKLWNQLPGKYKPINGESTD